MSSQSHVLITATQLGSVLQATRKALGLSQSRVSHLELNAQELSFEQLLAWCAALDLELAIGIRGNAEVPPTQHTDW